VTVVNVFDSNDTDNLDLLSRPDLGVTFTKLHCWRLTQYSKCVFMDADTLVKSTRRSCNIGLALLGIGLPPPHEPPNIAGRWAPNQFSTLSAIVRYVDGNCYLFDAVYCMLFLLCDNNNNNNNNSLNSLY